MYTFKILFEGDFETVVNSDSEIRGFYAIRFSAAKSKRMAIYNASNEIYDELNRDFSIPKFTTIKLTIDECEVVPDHCLEKISGFTFF